MRIGEQYFIPSMRRECVIRLYNSMKAQKNHKYLDRFEHLLREYSHRDKEIVFLVNEDVKTSKHKKDLVK